MADEALEEKTYAAERGGATLAIARQALQLAEADRAILLSERSDIEMRIARTEVRAPVAGRILKRTGKVGALAGSAGGELFLIASGGEIELEGEVPQVDFMRIPAGASVEISIAGRTRPISGRVRRSDPGLRADTRMGVLRISLEAEEGLPVGAFARGEIEVARRRSVLLPSSALILSEEGVVVQLVEDGVVRSRTVEVGLRSGDLVEILSGVEAGEAIVLKAGSFVSPGDRIAASDASYDLSSQAWSLTMASDTRP